MKKSVIHYRARRSNSSFQANVFVLAAVMMMLALALPFLVRMLMQRPSLPAGIALVAIVIGILFVLVGFVQWAYIYGVRVTISSEGISQKYFNVPEHLVPWKDIKECGLLSGTMATSTLRYYVFFSRHALPEEVSKRMLNRYDLFYWGELILLEIDLKDVKRIEELCVAQGLRFADRRTERAPKPYQ